MSNNNQSKPPLLRMPAVLGGASTTIVSSPPNPTLPAEFTDLLTQFPLPWIVGPYDATDGTYMIFVAGDVEKVTDASRMNEYGAVFNGWIATCAKPRLVVSLSLNRTLADLFVYAANKLAR